MGSREEPARIVVLVAHDRTVAGPADRCEPSFPERLVDHFEFIEHDTCWTTADFNIDHDIDGFNWNVTGVPGIVVFARGRYGCLLGKRQDLRLFEDQPKRYAVFGWSRQMATGLGRKRRFPPLALRLYVEEDQEAQGAPAPLEGEPRQAPEHGARLINSSSPRH